MSSERSIYRAFRRRLMARASALALRMAQRPRGWAPGVLIAGLIGAPASALAQASLLTTEAELIIRGGASDDQSGFSVSGAGDVNGDGIDDLIIGARFADPKDRGEAGATYVVFGTDRGLPSVVDLATDADLVIQGARAGDLSGFAVSGAGDVNGDGIDDLLIGAPAASRTGRRYAGASYVILGSDRGLPATIDLATDADVVIRGAADNDYSGYSVSGAGDVNGDGIDDLVIGARLADPKHRFGAGAAYVVFGTDQGLPAVIDLADGADVIIQGGAAGDQAGRAVSGAGDVNGDGIDDLLIGSFASVDGRDYAGVSYVVFGALGLSGRIDLADPVKGADLIIQGPQSGAFAGGFLHRAGDLDGDGTDDLCIGAPGASPNGRPGAGISYVILGSDQGLPATIDLATDADVVILGAAADDGAGVSVSGAGDVDGDGIGDLLIGAPGADPGGRDGAGVAYVVLGTDRGWPATIDLANEADLIIRGAAASKGFAGRALSGAGDVDGDGIDDLIVGAPYADPKGRADAGASFVVLGGPAAALERLIAAVGAADLPRRLETRLGRKLGGALKDVGEPRLTRAILRLQRSVGAIEAQRGATIDPADADHWIADANAIIDLLKAPRKGDQGSQGHAPGSIAGAP